MREHRFAIATALATFVLLIVGSLVHGTGSSLACPDWPLCYGVVLSEDGERRRVRALAPARGTGGRAHDGDPRGDLVRPQGSRAAPPRRRRGPARRVPGDSRGHHRPLPAAARHLDRAPRDVDVLLLAHHRHRDAHGAIAAGRRARGRAATALARRGLGRGARADRARRPRSPHRLGAGVPRRSAVSRIALARGARPSRCR